MSPWESGTHVTLLQNSLGRTSKAPKFHRAHFKGSQTPPGKFAVYFCPAEFWSLWNVPRGIMEPLKCALRSFGAIQCVPRFFMETFCQNIHTKSSKTEIAPIFQGHFCKPLSFERSIHSLGLVFKKKIFCVTLPLMIVHSSLVRSWLVFNPLRQFVFQLELYSQLQLGL